MRGRSGRVGEKKKIGVGMSAVQSTVISGIYYLEGDI